MKTDMTDQVDLHRRRPTVKKWAGLVVVFTTALAVSACSNFNPRKTLGLENQAPDEFTVLSKAPLTVPPDFTLRPPKPGAVRSQDLDPQLRAKESVFGSDPDRLGAITRFTTAGELPASKSPGEISLLQLAGVDQRDPNIREIINQETSILTERETTFVDDLIFWQDPQPSGTVVNPTEEARRIQENQAVGEAVTQGETPVIRRRRRALLEGIFN